eukprot:IDg11854t1
MGFLRKFPLQGKDWVRDGNVVYIKYLEIEQKREEMEGAASSRRSCPPDEFISAAFSCLEGWSSSLTASTHSWVSLTE